MQRCTAVLVLWVRQHRANHNRSKKQYYSRHQGATDTVLLTVALKQEGVSDVFRT